MDSIIHNWNLIVAELRDWQELGIAIEQVQMVPREPLTVMVK